MDNNQNDYNLELYSSNRDVVMDGRIGSDGNLKYTTDDYLGLLDMPGDIQRAKKHYLASKIFDEKKLKDFDICEDCYNIIPPEENIPKFPILVDPKMLARYGLGVYMYFFYIKFVIYCLLILLCMVCIPQMYYAKDYKDNLNSYCNQIKNSTDVCIEFFNIVLENKTVTNKTRDVGFLWSLNYENIKYKERAISNATNVDVKEFDPLIDVTLLSFICEIVLVIMNILFMNIVYNLDLEADIKNITPEDFALRITNIPKHLSNEEIKDVLSIEGSEIIEVLRTYKINEFLEYKNELIDLKKKLKMLEFQKKDRIEGLFSTITKDQIKSKIDELELKISNFLSKVEEKDQELVNSSIIAIFKTSEDKEKYDGSFPSNLLEYFWGIIKLTYAVVCCSNKKAEYKKKLEFITYFPSEPTDIIWENLEYSTLNRFIRTLLIYFLTAVILFISFWILWGINIGQRELQNYSRNVLIGISVAFSTAIAVINFVIRISLRYLTYVEKNTSHSDFYLSYSFKLMIALFCNTALLPIAVAYFTEQWSDKGILISNSFIFFISNSIVTPLLVLVNPQYYINWLMRWHLTQKYEKNNETMEHTQRELNEYFSDADMDLADKYSYIGQTLLMSILYIPLLPVGCLISLIGLSVFYFIEKYNVTSSYKRPPQISSSITFAYISNFRLIIFVFAISIYSFYDGIYLNYFRFALFSIIAYGILILLPYTEFLTFDLIKAKTVDVYEENYFKFTTMYESENPITKKKSDENYLGKLLEKGIIDDETFKEYSVKLGKGEFVNLKQLYVDYNNRQGLGNDINIDQLRNVMRHNNNKINNNQLDFIKNAYKINASYFEDYDEDEITSKRKKGKSKKQNQSGDIEMSGQ